MLDWALKQGLRVSCQEFVLRVCAEEPDTQHVIVVVRVREGPSEAGVVAAPSKLKRG